MKQVALISDHGDPLATPGSIQSGGQNVYVRHLALALDHLGWQVDVFTHRSELDRPETEGMGRHSRVVRLDAGRPGFVEKGRMFPLLPTFLSQLESWSRQHRRTYTVVHTNYWLSGWVGMRLKQRWGVPQVHTFHSLGKVRAAATAGAADDPAMVTRLHVERALLRTVDRVIATSPVERSLLMRLYQAPEDRIAVIPCGVDPKVFFPRDQEKCRAELGLAGVRPVLFAGRFEHNKGLHVLLAGFAQWLQNKPELAETVRLVVVGGAPPDQRPVPPEQQNMQRLVRRLGLQQQVVFAGPRPQEALAGYMAAAEVTVVPSYYETFGMVALEAMASGCPVIASRVGGLTYTVQDGDTGLLVPPGNPQALARALDLVLGSDRLRDQIRGRLAGGPDPAFSWPAIATGLAGEYERLGRQGGRIANNIAEVATAPGH